MLFVCSRNQWRSPTAEAVFSKWPRLSVRSAGTSPRARRRVQARDLAWADLVVVMERHHRDRLRQRLGRELRDVAVVVLGIPDDYTYMDPALVAALEDMVPPVLQRHAPEPR